MKNILLRIFKVKKPLLKFCLTNLFIIRALLFYFFDIGCSWKNFFGLHCYGCGLTSAFFAVIRLDFSAAFRAHFMFWSIPILYCYFWFDGKLTGNRWVDMIVLALILFGFVVRWILYYI
ncbi:MAG: DUF2752 domain-containing protein [Clostridia bacterium]|nr:DUF2752 domain-containing protein [Clostridia bacterium]